jgi:diaminopimelate decarboxylase
MTATLRIGSLTAAELVERFGTPLYVISEDAVRDRYRASQAAVAAAYPTAEVFYAVKANPILAVRRILAEEGAGGDAFSLGEVEISLRAGVPGERLVMNGQAKGEPELECAVRNGITVTLDNEDELELLIAVAARLGIPARAFVRLKLDLTSVPREVPGEGEHIRDRVLHTVWGLTEEEAARAVRRCLAAPQIELRGYHHHIGYFVPDPSYHASVARDVVAALVRLRAATGFEPSVLDLGGGWAYPGDPESGVADGHAVPPPDRIAQIQLTALSAALDEAGLPRPRVILELGRSLVGGSGTLLARVRYVKRQFGRRFVVTDASKHLLLRASIEHYAYRWVKADDVDAPLAGPADLFGPTCTDDELVVDYPFPDVNSGDVVAALATGAYAETFGARLNSVPRPAVVLVRGDQAAVAVRRESVEDVLARYELPEWLTQKA